TTGVLKVAHCGDLTCSNFGETISPVPGVGDVHDTSITIGTDGLPIISYGCGSVLRVTHCNDLACAGIDEVSANVDSTPGVRRHTSITIGVDGLPIVSYYK